MTGNIKSAIKLVPDLDNCIETVARKAYRELSHQLMTEKQGDESLIDKITTLEKFLETADFRHLRARSEKYLINGKELEFNIYLENDSVKYQINVIPPALKK